MQMYYFRNKCLRLRKFSTGCNLYLSKCVYISQSNDVFRNLALEDYLYHTLDLTKKHVLLLWRNSESLVIGRHQNPWLEADISFLYENNINMARRNSGGGAVYHDSGNLNITFLAPRNGYNRKQNLQIILNALRRGWEITAHINKRDDIVYEQFKISGTASKLGRLNTYHHLTLLVDSNKYMLTRALNKSDKGIETNATRSTPAKVINVSDITADISVERLITVIAMEYLRKPHFRNEDKPCEPDDINLVMPTEENFPGISRRIDEFNSWKWIFGRTPKFKMKWQFNFDSLPNISIVNSFDLEVTLIVEHGKVVDMTLVYPVSFLNFIVPESYTSFTHKFLNCKFSEDLFQIIRESLKSHLLEILNDNRIIDVLEIY